MYPHVLEWDPFFLLLTTLHEHIVPMFERGEETEDRSTEAYIWTLQKRAAGVGALAPPGVSQLRALWSKLSTWDGSWTARTDLTFDLSPRTGMLCADHRFAR